VIARVLLAVAAAAAATAVSAPARAGAVPAGCDSQPPWSHTDRFRPEYDFPERSWLGVTPSKVSYTDPNGFTSDKALIFEADLAPHIGIIGFGWGNRFIQCGWRLKVSWVFTPEVRIRMLNAYSAPVIPPSFMPRPLQFQLFGRRLVLDSPEQQSGNGHLWEWTVTATVWAHHSNGQTGCLYRNQTLDLTQETCSPVGSGPLNQRDGSFSTNYLELAAGLRYAWRATLADGPLDDLAVDAGVQYHPIDYLIGGQDAEQAALWGRYQMWIHAEGIWTFEAGRLLVEGDFRRVLSAVVPAAAGGPEHTFTARARASYFPPRWFGAGLFVAAEYGQDTYNILFTHTVDRVLVGTIIDWSRGVQPSKPVNAETTKLP
jgi:hypothetical protein